MVISKNGSLIQINQLSDGEKSLLALVGGYCKAFNTANPSLENPYMAKVLFLIDEIELAFTSKMVRSN